MIIIMLIITIIIDMKLAICFGRYRGGKWEAVNSHISLSTYMKFSPLLDGT